MLCAGFEAATASASASNYDYIANDRDNKLRTYNHITVQCFEINRWYVVSDVFKKYVVHFFLIFTTNFRHLLDFLQFIFEILKTLKGLFNIIIFYILFSITIVLKIDYHNSH